MKKHTISFMISVFLCLLLLSSCAAPPALQASSQGPAVSTVQSAPMGAQIVLISCQAALNTAFGQGIWATLSHFAGQAGFSSVFYTTEDGDKAAAASTLELAAKSGAKLVVAMHAEESEAFFAALGQYPEIDFILIDPPNNAAMPQNAAGIGFSPEEAGWLAGYTAGGQALQKYGYIAEKDDFSQRFLLGYALGLDAALAQTQGRASADSQATAPQPTPLMGTVLEDESPPEEWERQVHWLLDIFSDADVPAITVAAGQVAQRLALEYAPQAYGMLAGVQIQPWPQAHAVASIEFDAKRLVQQILAQWAKGRFPGGQALVGGLAQADISLLVEDMPKSGDAGEGPPQEAMAYYIEKDVKTILGAIKPKEDGSLPTLAELQLERLQLDESPLLADESQSA